MEAKAETLDMTVWKKLRIPTINVHLLSLEKREGDDSFYTSERAMHYVNVMIPFATTLLSGIHDLNQVLASLSVLIEAKYRASPRGQSLLKVGEIIIDTRHHKKTEYEYLGVRYVVSACSADRPAISISFQPTDTAFRKKPVELLHFYVACGLNKQHDLQTIILARVRDFDMAKVVAQIAHEELEIGHVSVRSVNKDSVDCGIMESLWNDVWIDFSNMAMPTLDCGMRTEAKEAASGAAFLDCVPFLKLLAFGNDTAEALIQDVVSLLPTIADLENSEGMQVEV
jgi:hypothetical protein